MDGTIEIPIWFAVVAAVLAVFGLIDRLLRPGLGWLLRRRVNRAIEEINQRLRLRLQPFKLTRRQVLVDRLIYDAQVVEAVEAQAGDGGGPSRADLMARVRRFAEEIVPAFNVYLYFRIGYWLARRVAMALYRVRLGYADGEALAKVDAKAAVVFVMNHRSNMDYLLVTVLAAEQTALSYAVGEWARVWPLQQLIRALGAYFVRRDSGDALYRRVLERYIAMATEAGVTQAVFPEGGLSRDGKLREPRLGVIDYMTKSFDPAGTRDVIFIPVALNYDRVLEDRTLLRSLDKDAKRRTGGFIFRTVAGFMVRNFRQMWAGTWHRFGYACVNFGTPISLRDWVGRHGVDLRRMEKAERFVHVAALARDLMAGIGRVIPVTPVSLIARAVLERGEAAVSALELKAEAARLMERLEASGARIYIPRADRDYAIGVGLRMLTLRRLVVERDGLYRAVAEERPLLGYYANAIAHLLPER
ncbi:MAG: glycerol-3-phosphate acyltransferase [Alphaproteobacteria bacterium]|nr:glycerol-3-phosphate acyltransferase [Alphaproteobacteria bacterium]